MSLSYFFSEIKSWKENQVRLLNKTFIAGNVVKNSVMQFRLWQKRTVGFLHKNIFQFRSGYIVKESDDLFYYHRLCSKCKNFIYFDLKKLCKPEDIKKLHNGSQS